MTVETAHYFKEGLTHVDFYSDIRTFINGFETVWAKERKQTLSQSRKKRAKLAETSDDEDPRDVEDFEVQGPKLKEQRQEIAFSDGFVPCGLGKVAAIDKDAFSRPSLVRPSIVVSPDTPQMLASLVVGGERFTTAMETLQIIPDSFFTKLVENVSEEQLNDGCGEFFIDRSPEMFPYILEYLRSQRYGEQSQLSLPAEKKDLEQLLREASFYDLKAYAESIKQSLSLIVAPIIDFVVVTSEAVEEELLQKTVSMMTQNCNERVQEKILQSQGVLAVVDQKLETFVTEYGDARVQIVVSLKSLK